MKKKITRSYRIVPIEVHIMSCSIKQERLNEERERERERNRSSLQHLSRLNAEKT